MKKKYYISGSRPIYREITEPAIRSYENTYTFNWQTKLFTKDPDYGLRMNFNIMVDELEEIDEEHFFLICKELEAKNTPEANQ